MQLITIKKFDAWNAQKKLINDWSVQTFIHPQEIWWASLGVNIGVEIDGKHENFERPVVILRVYNAHSAFVAPITTKVKDDKFHCKIMHNNEYVWVKMTQARTISTKRILRKMSVASDKDFSSLRRKMVFFT